MTITITVKEALEKGIWDEICKLKGFSVWCLAEGLMSSNEVIRLTEKEAKNLGLIK